MSTVRSNTDYITADISRALGFVANSRRMNGKREDLSVSFTHPYSQSHSLGHKPCSLSLETRLSYPSIHSGAPS